MTTYEARAGFAVADAIRAAADELSDALTQPVAPIRLAQMAGLLFALADVLDQPPNLTREDVEREAMGWLRGMCKHD